MRLPSVVESRVIFSASSEPPCENISSNACRRAASISRTASPWVATVAASVLGALAEGVGDLVAARDDGLGDARAGLLELGHDVAAAQAEIEHQRVAGRLERELTSSPRGGDGFGEAAGGVDQRVGDLLRAVVHHLTIAVRLLREALGDVVEPASIICARLVVSSANSSVMWSVLKFRLEVSRSLALAMAWAVSLAGALQPLQQVAAALAERADHGVAGAAERERDVLALLGQRLRDLLRAVVDLLGDEVADRGDVVATGRDARR